MSQYPSQDLLRAASGVSFLPLGPNVNPAVPRTPATLSASAWGYYPDDTPYAAEVEEEALPTQRYGLVYLPTPSPVKPTYRAGYARNRGQSVYPSLWNRLNAWCPGLGNTGIYSLPELTRTGSDAVLVAMEANNWGTIGGRQALQVLDSGGGALGEYGNAPISTTSTFPLCLSTWAYPQAGCDGAAFSLHLSASQYVALRYRPDSGGTWELDARNGAQSLLTSTGHPTGRWYHIVGRMLSSTTCDLWVDGKKANDKFDANVTPFSPTEALIGTLRLSSEVTFRGYLDSLFCYHRLINPQEVRTLYGDPWAPFRLKSLGLLSGEFVLPSHAGACAVASEIYFSKSVSQMYYPGAIDGEVYQAGAKESQRTCS